MRVDVAVVGGGLSGLVAATALTDDGRNVVVLEQAPEPGGRLATIRLGDAVFDHGAQFFTARSDRFTALIDTWRDAGCGIRVWCDGFALGADITDGPESAPTTPDGYPRYVVDGGMQSLARYLAQQVDVRTGTRVTALDPQPDGWKVRCRDTEGTVTAVEASTVVLTPPGPSGAALLGDHDGVRYLAPGKATIAVMVALDGAPLLPEPGGVQFSGGPVRWMADNAAKGVSPQHALTAHLADDESTALFDAPDDEIHEHVTGYLGPWLGQASIVNRAVRRWSYAGPREIHDEQAVALNVAGSPVVLAGDAFAGPKVEGAAMSGLAAAALC